MRALAMVAEIVDEPRTASPTQRGSRLLTVARTDIRFQCRSACTIRPFGAEIGGPESKIGVRGRARRTQTP